MRGQQTAETLRPVRLGVQAIDVIKDLAATGQKRFLAFHGDFFQRFEAIDTEARAGHIDPSHTFFGQLAQGGFGVGLQPLLLAKARLKRHRVISSGQPQALGEQAPGLVALAVVRIAQLERARRHAVKAHDEFVRPTLLLPVRLDFSRQGLDVKRLVVKVIEHPEFGHAPAAPHPGRHCVQRGGRGGRAILRIERHQQDASDVLLGHLVEHTGHRRVAVAHGISHLHMMTQPSHFSGNGLREVGRARLQGRAALGPDRGVLGRGFGGTNRQNDAVEDQPPNRLGNFDHPRVAEKLTEVATQGRCRRRIGRAQIDEKDGSFRCGTVRIRRRVGQGHENLSSVRMDLEHHRGRGRVGRLSAQGDFALAMQHALVAPQGQRGVIARVAHPGAVAAEVSQHEIAAAPVDARVLARYPQIVDRKVCTVRAPDHDGHLIGGIVHAGIEPGEIEQLAAVVDA